MLAIHATMFCKELWEPVVDALRPPHPVAAMDQRGHGDSSMPAPPLDWWDLGRDAAAVVAAAGLERPLGLGHSAGATTLVMAELLHPGTFGTLVLVEPIVFPAGASPGRAEALAQAALRRRRAFPSPEAAQQALRGRGPFAEWTDRSLGLYVAHGFHWEEGEWALKCRPETEAAFYRGIRALPIWDRLGEVSCPVTLVAGERSDSHPASFAEATAARFACGRLVVVPGVTHFLPMEQPEGLAELVGTVLAGG